MSCLNIWAETLRGRNVQSTSSVFQEWNDKEKKKETMKELHKSKKLSNYRLLYSAGSNFKDCEVDIPKSMLIKGICTSIFFKVFFRVQNVFTVSSEIISILSSFLFRIYLPIN